MHVEGWGLTTMIFGQTIYSTTANACGSSTGNSLALAMASTTSMAGKYTPELDARLLGEYGLDDSRDLFSLQSMKWVVRLFEASWSLVMDGLSTKRHDAAGKSFDYAAHAKRMFDDLSSSV
jgi:hypothetical protein